MTSLAIRGNNLAAGQYPSQYGMQGAGIGRAFNKVSKIVNKTTKGIQNVAEDLAKSKIISKTLKTAAPLVGLVSEDIGNAIGRVGDRVESVGGRKRMSKKMFK